MKIQGQIEKVMPVRTGTRQDGSVWKRQDFVLAFRDDNTEFFFQHVLLSADLDKHPEPIQGKVVNVYATIFAAEYNGRYYNRIDLKEMELVGEEETPAEPTEKAEEEPPF